MQGIYDPHVWMLADLDGELALKRYTICSRCDDDDETRLQKLYVCFLYKHDECVQWSYEDTGTPSMTWKPDLGMLTVHNGTSMKNVYNKIIGRTTTEKS